MAQAPERVATGSKGLDAMLYGGFLPASAVLLEGAAGTGKTILGLQFLMEGMRRGEKTLLVTFEEFPEQYYDCAAELGWDLRAMEAKGSLTLIFTTPEEFLRMVDNTNTTLSKMIEKMGYSRAVIDSITHCEKLAKNNGELRKIESDLVNFFKQEDITTILLKENHHVLGGMDISSNKIPFIVDCYLILKYLELNSEIQRGILILKMRGSNHDRSIRSFCIEAGGLRIGEPFKNVSGIFGGTGIHTSSASTK